MAAGESGTALEAWREQLGPALAHGARTHPDIILAEVANLLGDEESGRSTTDLETPRFLGRYAIDRGRAEAVLGGALDDVLALVAEYEGSNLYVMRAKEEAARWLRELRGHPAIPSSEGSTSESE